MTLSSTFSALKHRNYRYYWLGQCVSLVGTAMQSAALAWLVYTVTGSPALLGSLAIFQFGPMLVLSLPAGVFIDRLPKRRVLMVTQTVFLLQALALSILAFTGRATYRMILPLASVYGVAQAFDYPCRRSFLIDLVGKDDLPNAISLNSTVASLARIVGPSIAGVVMSHLGGGWAFMLNAISYTAVIAGLALVTVEGVTAAGASGTADRGQSQPAGRKPIMQELAQGLRYVWDSRIIRATMLMGLAVMIFGLNENVLVPVFADKVLHAGVEGYGVLMSAVAAGALVAAAGTTVIKHRTSGSRALIISGIAIGAAQIVLSMAKSFTLTAAMLAVVGFGGTLFSMTMYSTVQTHSDPELRGRVSSVNALVETGTMPVGNAFAGSVTGAWGAPAGFLVCGIATIATLVGAAMPARARVDSAASTER